MSPSKKNEVEENVESPKKETTKPKSTKKQPAKSKSPVKEAKEKKPRSIVKK